jgi:phage host-nuclease inhibitor protein Gam
MDLDHLRRQEGLQKAFVEDLNKEWDHFRKMGRARLLRAKREVGTEAFTIEKQIKEGDERCVLI